MGGATALWGGFSSFFSVWQLCVMQISPFFVAFLTGAWLAAAGRVDPPAVLRWTIPLSAAFAVAFSLVYALLIASALALSRSLIGNLGALRYVAAALILLGSLQILLAGRVPALERAHRPAILSGLAALLGVAFALVYSPCITPMLSDIMALASQRATAAQGWHLAFWYGIGLCLGLFVVSLALILLLKELASVRRNARRLADVCGAIVLALAFLNLTGLMRHYKAFALGFAL